MRTSCPLSTEVYPFPEQSLGRYEVQITDGGPGDVDGATDGACLFRTRVCLGSATAVPQPCEAARIGSFSAKVVGLVRSVGDATAEHVAEDLSMLFDGPENPGHSVEFAVAPLASDHCVDAPVRVPADASPAGHRSVRLAFRAGVATADGTGTDYRSGFRLKCIQQSPSGRVRTRCRARGRDCAEAVREFPPRASGTTPGTITTPTAASTTTSALASQSTGHVFYLSPSGNDGSSGTSVGSPWRTFGRVLNSSKLLRPGDTLVLLDGTYTRTTTGLPRINCGTSGTAVNGEAGKPITIRALNERKAHLQSDGLAAAFEMSDCSWWVVQGLRASNADNGTGKPTQGYPFRFVQVSNVTGRRLLGSHNNRRQNTHVFAVEYSQNVLLEECEAYYFHRHGYSIWRSRYVTLRRCYANSMLYGKKGCCSSVDIRDYGDEAISLYGTSDSIIENSISENKANGFQIHGISSPLDPSGHGGRNNRILGSISLQDAVPSLLASRASSGTYHNASGNLYQNFLAALGEGHGIFLRGAANNRAENVTLYGSATASGLSADSGNGGNGATCSTTLVCAKSGDRCSLSSDCPGDTCTRNPQGCSFTARNALSISNRVYGFRETDHTGWLLEHSNAFGNASNYEAPEVIGDASGNVRSCMSTAPTGVGMGPGRCLAWIPASSNMARAGAGGASLGASILFRYDNGSPTTEPLWDPVTRAFPCGAVVPGVNDGPTSCRNVHTRLGITGDGCRLPPGYGD